MVLLYIFVAHDNIEDVFSYMLIFAEREMKMYDVDIQKEYFDKVSSIVLLEVA